MNALQRQLAELPEDRLAELYQRFFATADGQLVLEDLKGRCFMAYTSFDPNPISPRYCVDPYAAAFREGMRGVVLYVLTQLAHVPIMQNHQNHLEASASPGQTMQ